MRVVSKRKLKEFWTARKHDSAIAESRLSNWFEVAAVKNLRWANFADLKRTFGSADQVGNCVVFDVGNNLYRLIGRINYRSGKIFVLKVMDHAEYDKKTWADECGCHQPPPKRKK